MIEASFTIREDEYLEAQKAYMHAVNPQARWIRFGLAGVLTLSIGIVLLTQRTGLATLWTPHNLPGAVFVLTIVTITLLSPKLQRRAFKKRYQVERAGMTDVRTELNEEGISAEVPAYGRAELLWSAHTGYLQTPQLILLLKGYTFRPIPLRAFAHPNEVEELVKRHLPVYTRGLARAEARSTDRA
ncbi:hypothetical protein SAMN05421770_101999 [Granulicella rosea]|uniref:YcxB-like protein n=1 Tax=Granulicella rosea TaxID=474952 RepID=A0A239EJ70_9BACT|nr:YcxB family protein [Granulicella rosea]SNS44441.1 hypothetical protein SAMN05421770_101999 [Granulicella rosea]